MLTRKKTSRTLSGLYFVLVPIVVLILLAFAPPRYYPASHHVAADSLIQNDLEFIAPLELDKIEIFSGFGDRVHPIYNKKMLHARVDFVSNEGDKVVSAESGVVVSANFVAARGNFIVIKHDETYTTTYSHLKEMSVKSGDQVQKGQTIGLVGNTGLSTRSHLHYEVLKNEQPVDPKPYLPDVK
jgi:murein DD-endopeptidase MepM/ murein hydrolase activator NlpD